MKKKFKTLYVLNIVIIIFLLILFNTSFYYPAKTNLSSVDNKQDINYITVNTDDIKNINTITEQNKNINEINNCTKLSNNFIKPAFPNKEIASCENLYNLDGSADFIYIKFENAGYAIYSKQTMELMEYSMNSNLPYKSNEIKYYAGPSNYLYKLNNKFYNVLTNKQLKVTTQETETIAQQIEQATVNQQAQSYSITSYENSTLTQNDDNNEIKSAPDINTDDLIAASTISGRLIENYKYFLANPTHGDNFAGEVYGNGNTGTCGPISAQLLLSFNNYYNDRRLITNKFLNGYNDIKNAVTEPEKNPNYCTDPSLMNQWTTGTRSEPTGKNSFYNEMITRIMSPNSSGSTINEVTSGIRSYLNDTIGAGEYGLTKDEQQWAFGYSPINSYFIKESLNEGRPLIISMNSHLGAINHDVVAYGYQDYTYPNGEGSYEGFVVHFGWSQASNACIWVNSAWCDAYITLKLFHTHDCEIVGNIENTNKTEYRCTSCGYRSDANPYSSYILIDNLGKNGNNWNIKIENPFNYGITVYYNKKMCFSGDAGKWLGLKDIEAFYLPAKNSTTKLISENFLATSIAVSHISKGIRFITYGYNLTQNGDMDIHYNIVDV